MDKEARAQRRREGVARVRALAETEKQIETRVRVALSEAGVLVWKHHVDNRFGRTGLAIGAADLICVVPPHGRFLAIEMKRSRRERPRDEQVLWLAMVRQFKGVSGIATSVEEAMALVALARKLPHDWEAT